MNSLFVICILVTILSTSPFNPVQEIRLVENILTDCNIAIEEIESITTRIYLEEAALLWQIDTIEVFLQLETGREIERLETGSFDVPHGSYMLVFGTILLENKGFDEYPTFAIITYDLSEFWILLLPQNIQYRPETVACGMWEINLDV